MARGQSNTNGVTPLADTGTGAAGTVTGTERSKLQGMDSVRLAAIGTVLRAACTGPVVGPSTQTTLASITLSAGTWLVTAHAFLDGSGGFETGVATLSPNSTTNLTSYRVTNAVLARGAAATSSVNNNLVANPEPIICVATGAATISLIGHSGTGGNVLWTTASYIDAVRIG